jgi:hypothetical protein
VIHGVIEAHNCEDADLNYTVGVKPGLPVGGDFWETSSWIAEQSYTIHPGEPRNWAQSSGRDFSLSLAEDEYEEDMTIFLILADGKKFRQEARNLSPGKTIRLAVDCLHGAENLSQPQSPPRLILDEGEGVLSVRLENNFSDQATVVLVSGRVAQETIAMNIANLNTPLQEAKPISENEYSFNTEPLERGEYTIVVLLAPKEADRLFSPRWVTGYYTK